MKRIEYLINPFSQNKCFSLLLIFAFSSNNLQIQTVYASTFPGQLQVKHVFNRKCVSNKFKTDALSNRAKVLNALSINMIKKTV